VKILNVFNKTSNSEGDFKSTELESQNQYNHVNLLTIDKYKKIKNEIIDSLEKLIKIYEESGSSNERIIELINKLKIDNFQIVVLGEFSRGKSTFINTLLNKNILPSNILPTTAVITKIYYGKEPRVKINYKDNK